MRWIDREKPELAEAELSLQRIIQRWLHASDVISTR